MQPIMTPLNPEPIAELLIVDDSPVVLQLLSEMLMRLNFKVRLATSGELALRAARNQPPDLILLDINLHGMSGYEVCQQLKADESLKAIPVIFISSLNEAIDKTKGFDAGGADYITKPFQFEDVEARVRIHLAQHRLNCQ
jgi:DNA-binding response OmpR family regulator